MHKNNYNWTFKVINKNKMSVVSCWDLNLGYKVMYIFEMLSSTHILYIRGKGTI